MSTVEKPPLVDQVEADAEAVIRAVSDGKRVTDPALRKRIEDRADRARLDILARHGVVEWAVEMIREARDE